MESVALAKPGRRYVDDRPRTRKAPAPEPTEPEIDEDEAIEAELAARPIPGPGVPRNFTILDATSVQRAGRPAMRLSGDLPQWCTQRRHAAIWPRAGWWTDAFWPAPHEKVPADLPLVAAPDLDAATAADQWDVLHGQILADGAAHAAWVLALRGPDLIGVWRTHPQRLPALLAELTHDNVQIPEQPYWTLTRADLDGTDQPTDEPTTVADEEVDVHDDPAPQTHDDPRLDRDPEPPIDPLEALGFDPYGQDAPLPVLHGEPAWAGTPAYSDW